MIDRPTSGLTRRAFLYLSTLASLAVTRSGRLNAATPDPSEWDALLAAARRYPFMDALFGRRSRRFGWGMEIPSGPLAYKSNLPPTPLDDFERSFVIAAGLGISGWHEGIPFTATQDGLCNYSVRYTGRTLPAAAGIGNADMFYTEDSGTYFVSTRNGPGDTNWAREKMSAAEQLVATVKAHTRQLSDKRIDPPRAAPHYSEHNLWNGNTPGSTLFMPVANVSEQLLDFLFIVAGAGYLIVDDLKGAPAGELDEFVKRGLINPDKKYPLSYMEQYLLTTCAVEMGQMGHNMALALQPLGLGGWFFSGVSPFTLMGVAAKAGVPGLGFTFEKKEGWGVPNALGIGGLYQAFSPPFYPDMRAAIEAFLELKFGRGGAYDPATPGPFQDNQKIKATTSRPPPEQVDLVVAIAQYIFDTYGKFPGTVPSVFVRYYTQAHRLETGFYDKFFRAGSYLTTHRDNVARWMKKLARQT
jgi:hypothetical protein